MLVGSPKSVGRESVIAINHPVHALCFDPRGNRLPSSIRSDGALSIPPDFHGPCALFAQDHRVLRLGIQPGQAPPELTDLPALARLPLKVWAHRGADPIAIRDHVANLNLILNGLNPAGMVFDLRSVSTPPPEAWELIGHNCWNEHEVRRSEWFDRDAANVYYHPTPDVSARCCHGGDMIFLPAGSPLGRLAHEIGHALGLRGDSDGSNARYDDGHTDSLPSSNPFTEANIMWRGNATLRHHLTLGQIAWMHGSASSILPKLAGQTATDDLPYWTDDGPGRKPKPETRDIETTLAARYEQILDYWDDGRRPEGKPGSTSAEEFVRLHLR